jgi:hypothetical protein
MPRPKKHPHTESAAVFLVARSPRPITLEVESPTRTQTGFAQDYSRWTGRRSTWAQMQLQGSAVPIGPGKYGIECRVYFPSNNVVSEQMQRYGFNVESGGVRLPGTLRINNYHLFRELVENHGLRLGANQ